MKIKFSNFLIAVLASTVISTTAFAQLSRDIQWATEFVNNSQPQSDSERVKIIDQVLARLGPHRNTNADVQALTSLLELQRDWLRLDQNALTDSAKRAVEAPSIPERYRAFDQANLELFDRLANYMSVLGRPEISAKDAEKMLASLKIASQWLDDIRDPSVFGGKASVITKLLSRADGIAKLKNTATDPRARPFLAGIESTLGSMKATAGRLGVSMPNPMSVFQLPAVTTAAMVDVTATGTYQVADTMDDVALAMKGDEAALQRLPGHAARIGATLSRENYGKAMAKAMIDTLLSKIPFVRTLAKWSEPKSLAANWLVGSWKVFDWQSSSVHLIIEFRQEAAGISGYLHTLNDEHLKSLGFREGELVFRNFRFSPLRPETHASGECRYIALDSSRSTNVKADGWRETAWRPDGFGGYETGDRHCLVENTKDSYKSRIEKMK
ncbi:MAG TPA: hypothetical protein VMM84_14980 [Pyrinomonadaceae bacterium]|nr:hypothetical protein [Pyrinomonadaceae bacterium]